MIKSLRWRLQLWHAAILIVAVTFFAGAFYHQLRRSTLDEIDFELLNSARLLEGTLRAIPPRAPGAMVANLPLDLPFRPIPRGRPGRAGPLDGQRPPFAPDREPFPGETPPYFAVFSAEGNLLHRQDSNVDVTWQPSRRPLEYRITEGRREVLLRGPFGTLIIVGRDVRHQMDRLSETLVQLVLIGSAVIGVGLVGGWWLAGKAIRPIRWISETAGRITAVKLSERIDTATMDSELQLLASTLNSMFDRLDHSFRLQSQFTADASHELRTPIAVLMSHCELALNRPRTAEEYQQTLAICQKTGERMKNLVDGLLTLARADAGKLELQKTAIDLRVLATEASEMFAPLAHARQVEIKVEGHAAVCLGDSARISQVIANLLHNAILYNAAEGKVSLETSVADGDAILRVRDNGPGIPPAAQSHLFDRFYRIDEARSRPSGGSGLGLAICKSITDAHAGRLSVESRLGEGCVFELRLPALVVSQ